MPGEVIDLHLTNIIIWNISFRKMLNFTCGRLCESYPPGVFTTFRYLPIHIYFFLPPSPTPISLLPHHEYVSDEYPLMWRCSYKTHIVDCVLYSQCTPIFSSCRFTLAFTFCLGLHWIYRWSCWELTSLKYHHHIQDLSTEYLSGYLELLCCSFIEFYLFPCRGLVTWTSKILQIFVAIVNASIFIVFFGWWLG